MASHNLPPTAPFNLWPAWIFHAYTHDKAEAELLELQETGIGRARSPDQIAAEVLEAAYVAGSA